MFSTATIEDMQREAAAEAAREKRQPFVFWPQDKMEDGFPIPNLGTYIPPGWRNLTLEEAGLTGDEKGVYTGNGGVLLFADATGWGAEDEPALSQRRLRDLIHQIADSAYDTHGLTVGWAVWEVGQFQVHVAAYAKEEARS